MDCPLGDLFKKRNSHFLADSAGRYTIHCLMRSNLSGFLNLSTRLGKMEMAGTWVDALKDKTWPVWRGNAWSVVRTRGRRHVETHIIEEICLPCNLCYHASKTL